MDPKKQIKFMTYNVWSREDVAVYTRMKAVGSLVQKHKPDVIFFQEITPYILRIFQSFAWWKDYHCSEVKPEEQATKLQFCLMLSKIPMENPASWKFTNTSTGRGYMEADINPATSLPFIHIATTQLESPSGPPAAQTRSMERYAQAEHAVAALSSARNVVLGGDMSWDDAVDMPFPLPPGSGGWADAWTALRPNASCCVSYTYDGIWNEDVTVFNGFAAEAPSLRRRSDRFVCKLRDYKLGSIELIGNESIGIQYLKLQKGMSHWDTFLNYGAPALHLRPSCHLGVVLTVVLPDDPSQATGQNWMDSWDDDDNDY
uniref:Endonuclease/exonuclease/phosphatase domain-containing protein n=1 Tax=Oryza punctata TaxID=4537 RepID=A0A0E0LL50_ORYPU